MSIERVGGRRGGPRPLSNRPSGCFVNDTCVLLNEVWGEKEVPCISRVAAESGRTSIDFLFKLKFKIINQNRRDGRKEERQGKESR